MVEGVDDDVAGDSVVDGDAECVAGVVVEPDQHLGVGAVGEPVVGEVGLPGFVWEVGFEADVGRLRAFAWFRDDQVGVDQPSSDGRHRDVVAVAFEVPLDRVRTSIETQLLDTP